MSQDEAAMPLGVAKEEVVSFQRQLASPEPVEVPPEIVERLSLLLGIYGAIANLAPDGPSRFINMAFREAAYSVYDGNTLIDSLCRSPSISHWYGARDQLRSLEAGCMG